MPTLPSVPIIESNTVSLGNSLAADFFKPNSVIFSSFELDKVFAPVSTFIPGTALESEINSGIFF